MKIMLATVLTIALIVIGYYIYKTGKEKAAIARTVGRTLIVGWIIVLCNLISLSTHSDTISPVAYSLYFIASDWMLYYLFRFSIEYIGNKFENHVNRPAMILLLAADSVSVLLNNFFGHLFRLKSVELFGGERYFELEVTPFFYIHYAIIFMLVTFCLIALYYRSFRSPVFYRKKYLTIAIITTVLAIINIFTVRAAVDVSVIGYVAEAISIYYCAFVYTPQKLLQKMLFQVTQDMTVAVLVLDTEGKKLYSNSQAETLLSHEVPYSNADGVSLEKWCYDRYINGEKDVIEEQIFYRDEDEVVLKIQLQRMYDNKKQLQGGYFVIQDRTEEINNLKKEQYLATHDSLTGLYNKDYFCEVSKRYLEKYPETEFLVICTDIKDFKILNDSFGTKVGDLVLKNVARMLRDDLKGAMACGRFSL